MWSDQLGATGQRWKKRVDSALTWHTKAGSFGVDTRGIGERSHSGMTAWRRLHCSYRLKMTAPVCASMM